MYYTLMAKVSVKCRICQKDIICYEGKEHKYCSPECRKKGNKPKEIGVCICGKKFIKRKPENKFCSNECYRKSGAYKSFNNFVDGGLKGEKHTKWFRID